MGMALTKDQQHIHNFTKTITNPNVKLKGSEIQFIIYKLQKTNTNEDSVTKKKTKTDDKLEHGS